METTTKKPEPAQQSDALPDGFALFKPSWTAFKVNFETFVWQLLLPMGAVFLGFLGVIAAWAAIANGSWLWIPALVVALGTFLFVTFLFASLIVSELYSVRGKEVSFLQAMHYTLPHIWSLAGLFVLGAIIILFGFLLLIVPGFIAIQRLLLSPYYLVDKNLGVLEAIRQSWRSGKNRTFSGAIWGVVWILLAINLVGLVPYAGWIASFALSIAYLCAPAIRYLQVAEHSSAVKS